MKEEKLVNIFRKNYLNDNTYYYHSYNTLRLSLVLNKKIKQYTTKEEDIFISSLYHDLGKYKINKDILLKRSDLTVEERKEIEKHVEYTKEMLQDKYKTASLIAYHHHENVDGSGYPLSLVNDELTVQDKILAISDRFSAISEKRPYKDSVSFIDTMKILKNEPVDQDILKTLKTLINSDFKFNKTNSFLIIPFNYNNDISFIDINPKYFSKDIINSKRLSKSLSGLIYNQNNLSSGILSIYKQEKRIDENLLCLNKNNKKYTFTFELSELIIFDNSKGFIVVPVQLLSVDDNLPNEIDLVDFLSSITEVRDKTIISSSSLELSLQDRVKLLLEGIEGVSYLGNSKPNKLEEKPKVFVVSNIKDNNIGYCLSNNIRYKEFDDLLKTNNYISHNGVSLINHEMIPENINILVLSYILELYKKYSLEDFLDRTSSLPRDLLNKENIINNYKKIIEIEEDYYNYIFRVNVNHYSKIDEINVIVNEWKDYLTNKGDKEKLETDLSNLEKIVSIANQKFKESEKAERKKRDKFLDLVIILFTSILSLFSITEGIFRISDRFSSVEGNIGNLIKIILGILLWVLVMVFTIIKNKKK